MGPALHTHHSGARSLGRDLTKNYGVSSSLLSLFWGFASHSQVAGSTLDLSCGASSQCGCVFSV